VTAVPSVGREEVFGHDSDTYFHGCLPCAIDTGLDDDNVLRCYRTQEVHRVYAPCYLGSKVMVFCKEKDVVSVLLGKHRLKSIETREHVADQDRI
jgi:hypothetical protein